MSLRPLGRAGAPRETVGESERTRALAGTIYAILRALTPMKNSEFKHLDPQHEPAWPWELEATRKFKADRARERSGQRQNLRREPRGPWVGEVAAVVVIVVVLYFAALAL